MRTGREVSKKSAFPSSFDRFQRGFVNVHTYIYICLRRLNQGIDRYSILAISTSGLPFFIEK